MPTYEYRCPEGHTFERRAKMSEAASELACPECGRLATRQLSGGAGLVFKGSGFYLTDYGRNAHRGTAPESAASSARKEGDSSAGESTAADKGGEAKPAEPKPAESKPVESKSSDKKSSESKSSEPRSSESKSSEKSGGASSASPSSPSKKSDE